jgi:hypothetical protein
MSTEIPAANTEALFASPVEALDSTNGVMFRRIEDLPHIDPEKRITLPRLCKELGNTLGWVIDTSADSDPVIGVSPEDLAHADVAALNRGLYINPYGYPVSAFKQLVKKPGGAIEIEGEIVLPSGYGVVFPADEYTKFPRNPGAIAQSVQAANRETNRFTHDRDEVKRRALSSAGQTMSGYIQELDLQESALIQERQLLRAVYREVRNDKTAVWLSHYKGNNLDKMRQDADELIHETVETAMLNLNLDSKEESAVHRAVSKKLYRAGSSREIARNVADFTYITGRWAKTRMAMVGLARQECNTILESCLPAVEAGLELDR